MLRAFAFVLALLVVVLPHDARALELPELAARVRPSVVLLTIADASGAKLGTGTGFFVGEDGKIATNHHVVEGASRAWAVLEDGRKIELAGILADDPDRDLALVATTEHGPFPTLPLGDDAKLRVGEEIVVYGSPMGLSGSLSTGVVAAVRNAGPSDDDQEPRDAFSMAAWGIQITAPISPGSSGSPVMKRDGQVVGVAVGRFVGGAENVNFAVPVSSLEKMLAKAAGAPKPFARSERSVVLKNLAISAAVIGAFGLVLLGIFRFTDREREPKPKRRV